VLVAPKLNVRGIVSKDDIGPMSKRALTMQRLGSLVTTIHQKASSKFPHCMVLSEKISSGPRKALSVDEEYADFLPTVFFRSRRRSCLCRRSLRCACRYTTCTCGICGQYNDVGKSREFKCSTCGMIGDRDCNAARNSALLNAHSVKIALIRQGYDLRGTVWEAAIKRDSIRKPAEAETATGTDTHGSSSSGGKRSRSAAAESAGDRTASRRKKKRPTSDVPPAADGGAGKRSRKRQAAGGEANGEIGPPPPPPPPSPSSRQRTVRLLCTEAVPLLVHHYLLTDANLLYVLIY
jgi:hypothetical protein